jgi:hypothetical protein
MTLTVGWRSSPVAIAGSARHLRAACVGGSGRRRELPAGPGRRRGPWRPIGRPASPAPPGHRRRRGMPTWRRRRRRPRRSASCQQRRASPARATRSPHGPRRVARHRHPRHRTPPPVSARPAVHAHRRGRHRDSVLRGHLHHAAGQPATWARPPRGPRLPWPRAPARHPRGTAPPVDTDIKRLAQAATGVTTSAPSARRRLGHVCSRSASPGSLWLQRGRAVTASASSATAAAAPLLLSPRRWGGPSGRRSGRSGHAERSQRSD